MANTFKNYRSNGITTQTTVFTGPAGTQTTVIGMSVANTGNDTATVSIKLGDTHISKNIEVPVGSSLVVIGGNQKLVVMADDTISVTSDIVVDAIISALEIA